MRIISGSQRGRKLLAPDGTGTRPTTDRVKESIFNIISPYLPTESVLDLFAGSGALGIEALSRGAKHAVFIENSKEALDVVKKNISGAKFSDRTEVIFGDALKFLSNCRNRFDIIFLDPPYDRGLINQAMDEIYKNALLSENGIILAEGAVGGEEPMNEHFNIIKRAKYGKTNVFVLKLA